jgi:uncharacterized protein YbjT (DUF2867 family)
MSKGTRIAVAGASGRVGRHVVDVLEERGHEAVRASRSYGVDIITGEGLEEALTGASSIIDVATQPSPAEEEATRFFTTATNNLQAGGRRAGVDRIVVVSIIGVDRFTGGYGAAKLAHEIAMLAGPVPARILRAAQFHEFVAELMQWGRQGDVVHVPPMRTQLVSARSVAEALVDFALADDPDGGPIWEIAGPRAERLPDVARLLAAHTGDPVRIEEYSDPSNPDHELYASGALLPGAGARLAGPTFAEWLASTAAPAMPVT